MILTEFPEHFTTSAQFTTISLLDADGQIMPQFVQPQTIHLRGIGQPFRKFQPLTWRELESGGFNFLHCTHGRTLLGSNHEHKWERIGIIAGRI